MAVGAAAERQRLRHLRGGPQHRGADDRAQFGAGGRRRVLCLRVRAAGAARGRQNSNVNLHQNLLVCARAFELPGCTCYACATGCLGQDGLIRLDVSTCVLRAGS